MSGRLRIGGFTAVVVVKEPVPGAVKTRLLGQGGWTEETAAELALAMSRCIVTRLRRHVEVVLAVTPDGCGARLADRLGHPDLRCVDQGRGTLGERLDRLWTTLGRDRPLAFFGGDSPDVPAAALEALSAELRHADVVVGPTDDGGYWTLGGGRPEPAVLHDIDWGGDCVYDQTCRRAQAAGLKLAALPGWHDVDRPEDVGALRRRLRPGAVSAREVGGVAGGVGDDEALAALSRSLEALPGDGEGTGPGELGGGLEARAHE